MVPKSMTEAFQTAVYDLGKSSSLSDPLLGYCYLLNKENLRCVELFEKYELVYSTLKFRLLTAQALFNSNNV